MLAGTVLGRRASARSMATVRLASTRVGLLWTIRRTACGLAGSDSAFGGLRKAGAGSKREPMPTLGRQFYRSHGARQEPTKDRKAMVVSRQVVEIDRTF